MNTNDVVYEYGKLHLNFTALTNAHQTLANSFAQQAKERAQLEHEHKEALHRLSAMTSILLGPASKYELPEHQLSAAQALAEHYNGTRLDGLPIRIPTASDPRKLRIPLSVMPTAASDPRSPLGSTVAQQVQEYELGTDIAHLERGPDVATANGVTPREIANNERADNE